MSKFIFKEISAFVSVESVCILISSTNFEWNSSKMKSVHIFLVLLKAYVN